MPKTTSFLQNVSPKGIYETLYAFLAAFGTYMDEPGTYPWSQGFPCTKQRPDGLSIPTPVRISQ